MTSIRSETGYTDRDREGDRESVSPSLSTGCQSNTTASISQGCAPSRLKLGILNQHVQLSSAASNFHHLIQTSTATCCPNVLPYRSCPAAMPFEIILRISHSFLTSWHKMLQAHLFHLPQTWNLPLPQGAMNLSNGKQYLMLGLFTGTKQSRFLSLVSIYNKLTSKSLMYKNQLTGKGNSFPFTFIHRLLG